MLEVQHTPTLRCALRHHHPSAQHFMALNELSYILAFPCRMNKYQLIATHCLGHACNIAFFDSKSTEQWTKLSYYEITLFPLLIRSAVCRKLLAP